MNETVTTILWSAPLSAALVSGVIWILRSWMMERLTNSIRHEYAKDLEQYKAKLIAHSNAVLEVHKANALRLTHIDRSHFDLELTSFQKLWSAISTTVDLTARIVALYSYEELTEGNGEKRNTAMAADKAFFAAIKVIQELRPFIPRPIYEHARALAAACKEEIDNFFCSIGMEERFIPTYNQYDAGKLAQLKRKELEDQWHELADLIQKRLQTIPDQQIRDPNLLDEVAQSHRQD